VETHYLAVAVDAVDPSRLAQQEVLAHLAALARARLQRRLERVRRLRAQSACIGTLVVRAIAAHLLASAEQVTAQPGLFINRSSRASTISGRHLEAIAQDAEDSLRADQHDQDLSVGPPTLEMFVRLSR